MFVHNVSFTPESHGWHRIRHHGIGKIRFNHPLWGTIGLPIFSWLYVRQQDVPKLPKRFKWTFQTKLQQAADLVLRAAKLLQHHGKAVWVVADGAYAKRPFVQPLLKQGITLVGRLRKDSALFDLPVVETQKRRGRKRIYGVNRISLPSPIAQPSSRCSTM